MIVHIKERGDETSCRTFYSYEDVGVFLLGRSASEYIITLDDVLFTTSQRDINKVITELYEFETNKALNSDKSIDNTCAWSKHVRIIHTFTTECSAIWNLCGQMTEAYKYCPSCGKRIVFN